MRLGKGLRKGGGGGGGVTKLNLPITSQETLMCVGGRKVLRVVRVKKWLAMLYHPFTRRENRLQLDWASDMDGGYLVQG